MTEQQALNMAIARLTVVKDLYMSNVRGFIWGHEVAKAIDRLEDIKSRLEKEEEEE